VVEIRLPIAARSDHRIRVFRLSLLQRGEAVKEDAAGLARQHATAGVNPVFIDPVFGAVIGGTSAGIFDLNVVHALKVAENRRSTNVFCLFLCLRKLPSRARLA
jgi:hypothetical protein